MYMNPQWGAGRMPVALQVALQRRSQAAPAFGQQQLPQQALNGLALRAAMQRPMPQQAMMRPGIRPQMPFGTQSRMPVGMPNPMIQRAAMPQRAPFVNRQPLAAPIGMQNAAIPSVPGLEGLSGNKRAKYAVGSY